MRAALFTLALGLSLAASSGRATPEVHAAVSDQEGRSVVDLELIRYGITQGGLAVVLLVVFWSYRRDFMRKIEDVRAERQILVDLVAQNTKALERLTVREERS